MFIGMDHVGVAVKNLDEAIRIYRDALGFKLESVQIITEQKVRIAFLSSGGETHVELLEPTGSDSTIARFLETRGEGIHHIAMRVTNIVQVLGELKTNGVLLIDEKPREGAERKKIAFVHPKSTRGVLLELCEIS